MPSPSFPAAKTSTICWLPPTSGCASRTKASYCCESTLYSPKSRNPHELFEIRAPSA